MNTRECSRNRPRIERTRTVSDRSGTPGRGAGGAVERVDERLVDDRVDLDPDVAAAAGVDVLDLLVDEVDQARAHRARRDEQALEPGARGEAGELVEQPGQVLA